MIRVKARYRDQKLELDQPIDLAEETEVEIEIHAPTQEMSPEEEDQGWRNQRYSMTQHFRKNRFVSSQCPPKGPGIYYQCEICGDRLDSEPVHSVNCSCWNVGIDVDAARIAVKDAQKVVILRRVVPRRTPKQVRTSKKAKDR